MIPAHWAPEAPEEPHGRPQEQADLEARVNAAWGQFQQAHPELAGDQDAVEAAAAVFVKDATAQGKSLDEAIDGLVDGTADVLRAASEAGVPADDPGRTAGTFGGQAAGNKPVDPAPEGTTFAQELRQFQDHMWGAPVPASPSAEDFGSQLKAHQEAMFAPRRAK